LGVKAQGGFVLELEIYRDVQNIAKKTHEHLGAFINSESTEQSIAKKACELLSDFGAKDTWYHGVPAYVLLGSRSCLSISGRDYQPANESVGETNLISVDLSPMVGDIWGDCARSYFVENGTVTKDPQSRDFQEGHAIEKELHQRMESFVTPETRFSELYEFGNHQINELGYDNLDFLGNLGHSIEKDSAKRRFIDESCHEKLGDVQLFTFEPHIRKLDSVWGFKYENIYYFNSVGRAIEL
jgi:Xaa-Pro aminopeptidase